MNPPTVPDAPPSIGVVLRYTSVSLTAVQRSYYGGAAVQFGLRVGDSG